MKLTRSLIFITFVATVALHVAAQDDTRASATWQVQKYDIVANLPTSDSDRSLIAKATLTIKNISSSPASTLSLRISPGAEITAITINGATADFSKREEPIGAIGSLQRASIRIPAVAPGSTATAVVDYKLTLKDNTGLGSLSPVGATFLPLSYWYPTPNSWYFARGADYAPFQIKVNAPAGQTVVSAGAEAAASFNQFLAGQPFFLSGSWDAINSAGVTVYVPKGSNPEAKARADELAKLATDAKAFIAGILGAAPETQLRLISTRRGAGFSQGGAILIDEGVFRRSKVDSLTAMNVAEAVAKLWIGGSVAIAGDGQGAIREGLPRFLATEFIENKFGKDIADIERARQRMAYFGVARRDSPLSTVSALDDYYFAEVANKGAMIWRILDRRVGRAAFAANIQGSMKDGRLDLPELRAAFSEQKDLVDYMFDQVTDMNLLIGLPQPAGAETKVALRNAGAIDATVGIEALTATGEKLKADATIRATSYGEVTFKTAAKITRVEIDPDKLFPQIEYSDDVAPKEFNDSDLLLAVKRSFDKQDYAGAESTARSVLRRYPRYDDVRVLLARSLLAEGRANDAGTEFNAVLSEKLPTARSLAWANEGLAEVAVKAGQAAQAAKYADAAIMADAEYGASLAARNLRNSLNTSAAVDADIKNFFTRFDKAAVSNHKAEVDALVVPGEVNKFVGGISGSTEQWQTQLRHVDYLDLNTALAEAGLTIKLLNREQESGTAVFRLVRLGNQWKLAAVDMFEVR
jgi:tetratricopeptide (TPR) repeat protein